MNKSRADRCVTHHHACDCREYELQERIQQLERERRWIPVSERLPEIGQTVLNYRVGGANRHADVEFAVREKKYGTRREDNIWEWITCGNQAGRYWGLSVDGSEVTHWMPLPPPPKENDNG